MKRSGMVATREIPLEAVFKALGHPVRLRLVREVTRGERCACELVAVAGLAGSTVSRHLGILREAGILGEERRGVQVFYHLRLRSVANFIAYMEDPGFRKRVDAFVDGLPGKVGPEKAGEQS